MSPGRKVAAFVAALVLIAGLGAAVGAAVGPIDTGPGSSADHDGADHAATEPAGATGDAAPTDDAAGGQAVDLLGTSSVQDGYRLVLDVGSEPADELRFTVLDPAGAPVVDTEVVHERPLHLIVLGRDLTTFLHLHPEVDADGTWSVPWPDPAPAPGSYRIVADLTPTGGPPLVLGADLTRPGEVAVPPSVELPSPATQARAGALDVEMTGTPRVGDTELSFEVTRRGEPYQVQPYLGARGHLVAFRAADLAYSHLHPHDGDDGPIRFTAGFPSAGTYRLFLDLDTGEGVVTAAFTVEVPEPAADADGATGPGGGDGATTTTPIAGAGATTTTDHPHEGGDDHEH